LYVCNEDNICVHKPLFPLDQREITGLITILILVGFAQAGGIGGGPILVPILIMGFNYNATKSVSIAFIIMFAGSLANYVSNCKSKTKEG
jgi:uncharacterized membrane protein YfcA